MNQSFSSVRRFWCQLLVDPFLLPLVLGYAILLLTACAPVSGLWASIAQVLVDLTLGWVILVAILSMASRQGYPRCFSRILTPNFYSIRLLSGRWTIYQRRAAKQKDLPDCKTLLKDLVAEQTKLPAALEPGRYKTLTHDTVLNRLRRMQNARDIVAKPAYMANMKSICAAMTGKRCKNCKEPCPFLAQREKLRQFYLVTFKIIST